MLFCMFLLHVVLFFDFLRKEEDDFFEMLNPHEVIFNFPNWKFHITKGSFPRGETSGFPGSKPPMLRGVIQPLSSFARM